MSSTRTKNSRTTTRNASTKLTISLPNESGFKENLKPKKSSSKKELEFHQVIGFQSSNSIPKEFIAYPSHFKEIPESDDPDFWLNQYPEPLQSYSEYSKEKHRSFAFRANGKKKIVYFISFFCVGEEQKQQEELLELKKVAEFSNIYFGGEIEFRILESVPIQNSQENIAKSRLRSPFFVEVPLDGQDDDSKISISLKQRRCHRYDIDKTPSDHRQFQVNGFLDALTYLLPEDGICLLGFTTEDLFDSSTDSFCAGMAAGGSGVGIFSFARYNPTFGEERKRKLTASQKSLLLQRAVKTAVHETGHLINMGHCVSFLCCMNGSGSLEEDFSQPLHLCPVCLRKVQWFVGGEEKFDVVKRYKQLLEFYSKHGFVEEMKWTNGILKKIM